jgi:hypothetical protein
MARCPICRGSALYFLEKFMDEKDLAAMNQLCAIGYQRVDGPLARMSTLNDCECKPAQVDQHRQRTEREAEIRKANAKPVLSLKRKSI